MSTHNTTQQRETPALEPLEPDERGIAIDVDQNIDSIVDNYVALSATRTTEQENR